MKAAVNERYGSPDVLKIKDVPTPTPRNNEILVKVHATTVTRTDSCALRAHPFFVRPFTGLFRPKRPILGLDYAGTIESIGKGVTQFSQGDRVFGLTPLGYGAHAEYVCIPEDSAVCHIPPGKEFNDVVVGEGAWYANTYIKKFNLREGDKILVYGASGAIGTAAVQLSKIYGAKVTAVVSTSHIDTLRHLGADPVIDYTAEDFTQIKDSFDYVLDAVGKTSYFHCRPLLKPNGVYAATDLGSYWQNVFLAIWFSLTKTPKVIFPTPKYERSFIQFLKSRIELGEYQAVIDRVYPFEDIVDAYRYVETGQKVGIVVVTIAPDVQFDG